MPAQPIQVHSLCIAIADKLRERILSHRLPPGSDLNDGALAREFGVSRTPVREAMKLLCHEGLLTALPRRGLSVTRLSAAQLAEACLLSRLLVGHLVQQRQTPAACTQLGEQLLRVSLARLQLALGSQRASQAFMSASGTAGIAPVKP
ncbi:GntR family transcriptional regulator [Comamonas sp.]|uniref:GntR family transcriptional regulator n=1 Tax=Comamonas sp. TaxID=34028 RepID=UPI0012CFD3C7|nr:GntR family transcriptional regulator [Comamonas sp.]MPS92450.1 GntR family transcriptional regulator [Comamonas sp.]